MQNEIRNPHTSAAYARNLTTLRVEARRLGTEWLEAILEPHGVVMLCDMTPEAVAAALRDAKLISCE